MDRPLEAISVFDIFKIGVGPSSSHTLGPWRAAQKFVAQLQVSIGTNTVESIHVDLFGSLAKTGKGHGTDVAVMLGLMNLDPETIDTTSISQVITTISSESSILLGNAVNVAFCPDDDISFHRQESLPFHPNGLRFTAVARDGNAVTRSYYSIGGGFVVEEGATEEQEIKRLPNPIINPEELTSYCALKGCTIPEVVLENELFLRSREEITAGIFRIWNTMTECVYRGCHTNGVLPGGLNVVRRAAGMHSRLIGSAHYDNVKAWLEQIKCLKHDFQSILKWVSCFALAVNEENAAFGRVVTAPTNGAAGVIPAVLMYYVCFCDGDNAGIENFLLTAGEIGSIFKKGATISAAMGGCQAEIGVSSAMAAGALTQTLGGTCDQVLMAAEIAMEHHLGMTCDPVGGLVQIPCIERNTMGAIKAITACNIALDSDPNDARVSLSDVIQTMWQTSLDMNHKYKETAEGGLAMQIPVSIPEC